MHREDGQTCQKAMTLCSFIETKQMVSKTQIHICRSQWISTWKTINSKHAFCFYKLPFKCLNLTYTTQKNTEKKGKKSNKAVFCLSAAELKKNEIQFP